MLNGVEIIKGIAKEAVQKDNSKSVEDNKGFIAIPYYAWANREAQKMNVWFPSDKKVTGIIP